MKNLLLILTLGILFTTFTSCNKNDDPLSEMRVMEKSPIGLWYTYSGASAPLNCSTVEYTVDTIVRTNNSVSPASSYTAKIHWNSDKTSYTQESANDPNYVNDYRFAIVWQDDDSFRVLQIITANPMPGKAIGDTIAAPYYCHRN